MLSIHPTPPELIMSGLIAGMTLIMLAAEFLPHPKRASSEEPADDRDDVRLPDEDEPGDLLAAA